MESVTFSDDAGPYRLPVCICLDTGVNTSDEPDPIFRHVLQELQTSFDNTLGDPFEPEISLVCCGYGSECCSSGFLSPAALRELPPLRLGQATWLGEGVMSALDALAERLELYRREGIPALTPRFILISNGGNQGDPDMLLRAAARVRRLRRRGRLLAYILCPGQPVRRANLRLFSPRLTRQDKLRTILHRLRCVLRTFRTTLRRIFTTHPTTH